MLYALMRCGGADHALIFPCVFGGVLAYRTLFPAYRSINAHRVVGDLFFILKYCENKEKKGVAHPQASVPRNDLFALK